MVEVLAKQYKEVFVHNILHTTWLDKKLERLRIQRKLRIKELKEVIPLQRIEIRKKAKNNGR